MISDVYSFTFPEWRCDQNGKETSIAITIESWDKQLKKAGKEERGV